jgi:hypothetical protein
MTNVASLADHRAKRGLPPATQPDTRSPLERIVDRYCAYDSRRGRGVPAKAAFQLIAGTCAKAIVLWAERAGTQVDDAARFQFYAVGDPGQETLQVRVSLVGKPKALQCAMEFAMECDTLDAKPLSEAPPHAKIKPLLTLPMSLFYRLS